MTVGTVQKPISKIKKIRSLDEFITRGGQAISAYREQLRGGEDVPCDAEFARLINKSQFGNVPVLAETLWQRFFKNGEERFFPSFKEPTTAIKAFRSTYGDTTGRHFIAAANEIRNGRIDLMGLKSLYVGTDVDWHREPLSERRSPLKHWKEFDELDPYETGNKKIIWELNRHQHFFTLGVAYWLTGDERYADTFARHLESWIEQNPPGMGVNWASSLEVAFRSISWIWAFHFFRESERFTPALFYSALKFLYLHACHIERYLSKYYSPNTHLTGEGLGLFYLGTQLPFFERAPQWRKLGEKIMFSEIEKQVLPDGIYFEQSTCYQRYTLDLYSHFVILRALSGEAYFGDDTNGLEDRLQTGFEALMYLTMPDGSTPMIGDDDGGRALPLTSDLPDDMRGTLAIGSILFDRPDMRYVAGRASQEIFWLIGSEGVRAFGSLEQNEPATVSHRFPSGGYGVMRDGWLDTDNCLIVDCGELGALSAGHGHADALAIEVAVHGKPLLVDSGTYTYHESRETRDYFRSTEAHNTLVIDGKPSSEPGATFSWRSRAEARCDGWIAEDRFDLFEGSHDGYERLEMPATHRRSILFLKNDYWIVRDLVETTGYHDYALNFHFAHGVMTAIGGDGAWVGGGDHRLYTFGDGGRWQQKESWVSRIHGNRLNAPLMRYVSRGEGPQEFFTFILPAGSGPAPHVEEVVTAIGRAFFIEYHGYRDIFIFNDTRGALIDNGIFESNFRYTWARMAEGETLPDEIVLIDGDTLRMAGDDIFGENQLTYAAIRRLGRELYVKTDNGRLTGRLSS